MTISDARSLAKQVAKQSKNVVIKIGETNGRRCLHLISAKKNERASETIFEQSEWNTHRWNEAAA